MSFIIKLQVIIQQVCTFTALTVKKDEECQNPIAAGDFKWILIR
jgi:hypothetical protein